MRSRLVGLFQLVNSPLDETDKIPSPQDVSHLLLQVGAHFRALQGQQQLHLLSIRRPGAP